jgi:5-formyltetrahydrofolate cyclo-ligase
LERSLRIVAALSQLSLLQRARTVGLFWPRESHREVDLRSLDARLRAHGVGIYYPFMDPTEYGFSTGFRRVDSVLELQPRGQAFVEPPPAAPTAARGDIDVLIVPALAVTPEAHRLGYGSGFYDATLPDLRPPAQAIIVAYSFQLLAELPTLAHDVACDLVVTDRELLDPSV